MLTWEMEWSGFKSSQCTRISKGRDSFSLCRSKSIAPNYRLIKVHWSGTDSFVLFALTPCGTLSTTSPLIINSFLNWHLLLRVFKFSICLHRCQDLLSTKRRYNYILQLRTENKKTSEDIVWFKWRKFHRMCLSTIIQTLMFTLIRLFTFK